MEQSNELAKTRRKFLSMLAASPVLAAPGLFGSSLLNLMAGSEVTEGHFRGWLEAFQQSDGVISVPEEALDVFDFEAAARKALPPAHFGYLATGVDDDGTVRANRDGYSRIEIRPRRLVDVEEIDMSTHLFGTVWSSPLVICPVGSQKAFHPEGEVAVARAARAKDHLQILSTVTTSSIEDVIAARGAPVWQQLYPTNIWEVTRAIVKRAEAAGSPAIALTVDLQEGSNRETLFRAQRVDKREFCLPSEHLYGLRPGEASIRLGRLRPVRGPQAHVCRPRPVEGHRHSPVEHELGFCKAIARHCRRQIAAQGYRHA